MINERDLSDFYASSIILGNLIGQNFRNGENFPDKYEGVFQIVHTSKSIFINFLSILWIVVKS